ncbi:uncharacterized protein LOC123013041 [Tribolium madens]|uniref:uncharacterized protein LOC123013041 n=1 Tax=Tribolium madens TaxID=41895 RepID=UPI001CF71F09|nr:uncharacterized protein LOC123013041 [Tribolium madens]XP_044267275.1 uncharacterized protein LOC123013041 [Tribolium madens]
MQLSHARFLALRLTIAQNVPVARRETDKLVFPTAFLLASLGVGVSTFSLKQLLARPKRR